MNFNIVKHTWRLLVFIAIQVLILNHVYLGGFITPFIYPIIILLLPFDTKGWILLVYAFGVGLFLDMFSETMGMHAAALVVMAFLRPAIIRLISTKTDYDPGIEPRIENNGFGWILLYTTLLLFIHHFALFSIEVFRIDEINQIAIRSVFSTLASTLIIAVSHLLMGKPS